MGFFNRLFSNDSSEDVRDVDYETVVADTADMVHVAEAHKLAKRHKLTVLDLTWEDTARYKGSAVGPNISDLTIQVRVPRHRGAAVRCMPVIRYPNFSDKTGDVSIDEIFLRAGNERGESLRRISLRDYLGDLRRYLTKPDSWGGNERSLLAEKRDRKVLVSAQACFLPVPQSGKAQFNPVIFNYQSYRGAPAVLCILASREGTSATIIDNTRDAFAQGAAWGQRLFFNKNGQRASLTGTRMQEFVEKGGDANDRVLDLEQAKKRGLNQVLLIQVPLVQPQNTRRFAGEEMALPCAAGAPMAAPKMRRSRGARSDVDEAVIGHGEIEGPFTEIDGLSIKRDDRYPIRVTVQFYKATSNGVVSEEDIRAIADQIELVYKDASVVGSLVTDGDTGRVTEYDGKKTQPAASEARSEAKPNEGAEGEFTSPLAAPKGWWEDFWLRQEASTGKSRHELLRDLERLLGRRPSEQELEEAIRRVFGGNA